MNLFPVGSDCIYILHSTKGFNAGNVITIMTQTVIISATAGPDLAAIINAALADPSVTTVILEPGLFLLHSSIIVPSGKTLMGSGREDTILRAAADFTWPSVQQNAVVVSENYSSNITLSDFSVDANRVSPDGLRLNGIMMRFTQDFLIERIDVSNATGYAHYAIGDLGTYQVGGTLGLPVSGRYEDLRTYNSQVHFEQYFADGITLFNIQARDGDGDISTETYFHPIVGSRNVTFEQVSGVGAAFLGFSLISSLLPLENIYIIDSSYRNYASVNGLCADLAWRIAGQWPVHRKLVLHRL